MIGNLARRPALPPALICAALGFVATLALIRAIRHALAESYDDGRIAGFVAGAKEYADNYRSVRRDRTD